ncbi:MAG: mobile mystery protein B [Candidatus Celaenobacter antarcticus]|nr:mobile mystery protein B [Candidatus Celaenobacter antarcticus]
MPNFEYPEGATSIDPNDIDGLLLTHITTRSELDRWEQDNIVVALAWLDQKKPKDIFNEQFIKELHRRMFGDVWKWAGKFRLSDKNIGCPWIQVPMCIKNLCDDTKLWLELKNESSDEIAVRFHHRLVSIHPFPNGNGRHARLITDILLENILGCSRFSWGSENLSATNDSRRRYIAALHQADCGNYKLLLEFVRT